MKIVKNAKGLIELRNSSTNVLESFFDPSGVFVNINPRAKDYVCISKTPTEQDETEAINLKPSDISHINGVEVTLTTPAQLMEQLALNFKKGGSTGEGVQVSSWIRPTDWLAIPTVDEAEEVFYGLYNVYNCLNNYVALIATGNYTVDWGDGTINSYSSGQVAEKNYNFSTLSNPITSEGYKQVLVKITPNGGSLLSVQTDKRHSSLSSVYHLPLVQIKARFNQTANGFYWRSYITLETYHTFLKSVEILGTYPRTDFSRMFEFCYSIEDIKVNTDNGLNFAAFIKDCRKLDKIPSNSFANGTSLSDFAINCYSLKSDVSIDCAGVNTLYQAFQNCYNLGKPPVTNTQDITNFQSWLYGCTNIKVIPELNLSSATNLTNFTSVMPSKSIVKSLAFGAKVSHSYVNQLLDATALNEIFTNLGTANAGASITITGNSGTGTCNQSIATGKGWTVIN